MGRDLYNDIVKDTVNVWYSLRAFYYRFALAHKNVVESAVHIIDLRDKEREKESASVRKCGSVDITGEVLGLSREHQVLALSGRATFSDCNWHVCNEDGVPGVTETWKPDFIQVDKYHIDHVNQLKLPVLIGRGALAEEAEVTIDQTVTLYYYCYKSTQDHSNLDLDGGPFKVFAPCDCPEIADLQQKTRAYDNQVAQKLGGLSLYEDEVPELVADYRKKSGNAK